MRRELGDLVAQPLELGGAPGSGLGHRRDADVDIGIHRRVLRCSAPTLTPGFRAPATPPRSAIARRSAGFSVRACSRLLARRVHACERHTTSLGRRLTRSFWKVVNAQYWIRYAPRTVTSRTPHARRARSAAAVARQSLRAAPFGALTAAARGGRGMSVSMVGFTSSRSEAAARWRA